MLVFVVLAISATATALYIQPKEPVAILGLALGVFIVAFAALSAVAAARASAEDEETTAFQKLIVALSVVVVFMLVSVLSGEP